jgi:hypothetical protein
MNETLQQSAPMVARGANIDERSRPRFVAAGGTDRGHCPSEERRRGARVPGAGAVRRRRRRERGHRQRGRGRRRAARRRPHRERCSRGRPGGAPSSARGRAVRGGSGGRSLHQRGGQGGGAGADGNDRRGAAGEQERTRSSLTWAIRGRIRLRHGQAGAAHRRSHLARGVGSGPCSAPGRPRSARAPATSSRERWGASGLGSRWMCGRWRGSPAMSSCCARMGSMGSSPMTGHGRGHHRRAGSRSGGRPALASSERGRRPRQHHRGAGADAGRLTSSRDRDQRGHGRRRRENEKMDGAPEFPGEMRLELRLCADRCGGLVRLSAGKVVFTQADRPKPGGGDTCGMSSRCSWLRSTPGFSRGRRRDNRPG